MTCAGLVTAQASSNSFVGKVIRLAVLYTFTYSDIRSTSQTYIPALALHISKISVFNPKGKQEGQKGGDLKDKGHDATCLCSTCLWNPLGCHHVCTVIDITRQQPEKCDVQHCCPVIIGRKPRADVQKKDWSHDGFGNCQ